MAEKRLIDADTLLETIHDTADGLADCDQQNAAWALRKYAARDIMDATTVDAVEVVRCKDCGYGGLCGAEIACNHPAYAQNEGVWSYDPEFFCAYGERRPE